MPGVDDLARGIRVVRRSPGSLCLALPDVLRGPASAALEDALSGLKGCYEARAQGGRFIVHYDAQALSAGQVAKAIITRIACLPPEYFPAPRPPEGGQAMALAEDGRSAGLPVPGALAAGLARLRSLLEAGHAPPGSLQARLQPVLASALTEKALLSFLNDLLAFYLVKVHWDLITRHWLKAPLAHADAWLTVFYFLFLLIRYRKADKVDKT